MLLLIVLCVILLVVLGVVSRVYWHFVRIFFMGLLGGVHYAATVGLSY